MNIYKSSEPNPHDSNDECSNLKTDHSAEIEVSHVKK